MALDSELEAMAAILKVLQPLDPRMRGRVIRWALEKLEISDDGHVGMSPGERGSPPNPARSSSSAFQIPALGSAWVRQNQITDAELESVFHETSEGFSVIAHRMPGRSRREQTLNCYLLAGVCSLLSAGELGFTDQKGRELCNEFGCLDGPNHSKYLSAKGGDFVGSKEKGWSLTAPGRKKAALLVKEIGSSNV